MKSKKILKPEFISIPPKPKEEDYEVFDKNLDKENEYAKLSKSDTGSQRWYNPQLYKEKFQKHQQTYYPLDYRLEHGMRRFEDEVPKVGDVIYFRIEGGFIFKKNVDGDFLLGVELKPEGHFLDWCYATEYNQAKEKQEQYGRWKGWRNVVPNQNHFKHDETGLVMQKEYELWEIYDKNGKLLSAMDESIATYDWVNGVVEMYEINRKRD